jgi:hypothetical protein
MTLKAKIKQAISDGISAEETSKDITDRVMIILAQEEEELSHGSD